MAISRNPHLFLRWGFFVAYLPILTAAALAVDTLVSWDIPLTGARHARRLTLCTAATLTGDLISQWTPLQARSCSAGGTPVCLLQPITGGWFVTLEANAMHADRGGLWWNGSWT
jgi:hypothetical protein